MLYQMERYLKNVEFLSHVRTKLDLDDQAMIRRGDRKMSYDERMAFYEREAESYDGQHKVTVTSQHLHPDIDQLSANVNATEVREDYRGYNPFDNNDDDIHQANAYEQYDPEYVGYDVSAAIRAGYDVNAALTGAGRRRGEIFKEDYMSLDTQEKKAWMSISMESRERIATSLENMPARREHQSSLLC